MTPTNLTTSAGLPLHLAMFNNNLSTIMDLVDAGADPKAEGADGDTPMIRPLDRAASDGALAGIEDEVYASERRHSSWPTTQRNVARGKRTYLRYRGLLSELLAIPVTYPGTALIESPSAGRPEIASLASLFVQTCLAAL